MALLACHPRILLTTSLFARLTTSNWANGCKYLCVVLHSGVQVAKKWKYLRDHFIRERKVIEKKQRNGCPIHGVDATPKWKYYKRLLFLLDHIRHRSRSTTTSNGVSGKEEEGSVECTQSEPFTEPEVTVSIASSPLEDSCVFERFDVDDDPGANIPNDGPSRTPSEQPPSKRLRKSDEQQAEMVNVIRSVGSALTNRLSSSSSSGMDTEAAFTYSVAQRLRNMSPQKNRLAQLKIQEVLYAVEYGD